jgi:hypothetical protein
VWAASGNAGTRRTQPTTAQGPWMRPALAGWGTEGPWLQKSPASLLSGCLYRRQWRAATGSSQKQPKRKKTTYPNSIRLEWQAVRDTAKRAAFSDVWPHLGWLPSPQWPALVFRSMALVKTLPPASGTHSAGGRRGSTRAQSPSIRAGHACRLVGSCSQVGLADGVSRPSVLFVGRDEWRNGIQWPVSLRPPPPLHDTTPG